MTLIIAALALFAPQPILLTDENFNSMRDRLAPTSEEMEWRRINWKPNLWSAMLEANHKNKPILLWVTEGLPLGCTDAKGIQARQGVFKSTRIQDLATKFVCAADGIQNLTARDTIESRTFAKATSVATPGIYLLTPSGISLGSTSSLDENVLASLMEPAISLFGKTPNRLIAGIPGTGPEPVWRIDQKIPKDGLVLRGVTRDLPREGLTESKWKDSWNMDFVWFTKSEVLKMLPPEPREHSAAAVPAEIVKRFARLSLLDSVRGIPLSFSDKDIQNAELSVKVVSVQTRNGLTIVNLKYTGNVLMSVSGEWPIAIGSAPVKQTRGIDLQILGRASVVWSTKKFTSFELIAAGNRWGASPLNNRKDDPGPALVALSFTLAANLPAEKVAPLYFEQYRW